MGGSVIRRRQLARELRQLRESSGYSLEVAAVKLEWSASKLSRIENGLQGVDIHSVRGMLDLYDLGGDRATHIQELTRAARERGWWRSYGIDDLGYVPLEAEATQVQQFELAYVPGLLQTPGYSRAVLAISTRRSAADTERELAVRMLRQRRLTSADDPLELVAVVDETALARPVGGAAAMRAQLEHLLAAAELPTVTLHVLPQRVGAHDGMDGAFSILGFGDLGEPDVVYAEHLVGSVQLDREPEVARVRLVFDRLRSQALCPAESAALVREVLDRT